MPTSKELFGSKNNIPFEEIKLPEEQMKLISWIRKSKEKFEIRHVEKKEIEKIIENAPSYAKPDFVFEIVYKENGFKFSILNQEIFEGASKTFGAMNAFHGSSIENWYSILYNSLQNYSHTKKMQNGAAFGDGM
jgi:hypothetical protein